MKVSTKHRTDIDALLHLLEGFETDPTMGARTFSKIIKWEIQFFDHLAKEARLRGVEGIKKAFREETSPCAIGGYDIVGGGEERWLKYFWGLLYPEAFVWNPGVNKDVIPFFYRLKEEEAFGERERQIVYGMLTSVSGLSFLFDREKERFRNLFTEKPDWPDEVKKSVEIQLGSFSFCESPSCGRLFVEKRKGNRFCSDACRKKAHAVPSSERKDPTTVRAYFYRKINEDFSREDAWEQTRKRHGETLKKLGLDGPKPPKTWAQNKEG